MLKKFCLVLQIIILFKRVVAGQSAESLSSSVLYRNLKINIYRTITEIWSLSVRQELSLRMFENRVFRRIFEPKKNEVTGNGEE